MGTSKGFIVQRYEKTRYTRYKYISRTAVFVFQCRLKNRCPTTNTAIILIFSFIHRQPYVILYNFGDCRQACVGTNVISYNAFLSNLLNINSISYKFSHRCTLGDLLHSPFQNAYGWTNHYNYICDHIKNGRYSAWDVFECFLENWCILKRISIKIGLKGLMYC